MSWSHLRTILWLRWRISLNQLKRSGIASTIILIFLASLVLASSLTLFFVALFVGAMTLPRASPDVLMYLWDIIVFVFLMFWTVGLLAELQRAEVLSLQKLLHLPVSLAGAFLINYLGSIISLTVVILLPAMIALCAAMVIAKGIRMLLVFPLLFGFLLMVTALTYQFQGWLSALMANQRKRRTVVVVTTMLFVLIFQIPNLVNVFVQRNLNGNRNESAPDLLQAGDRTLKQARDAGEITPEEYSKKYEQLVTAHQTLIEQETQRQRDSARHYASLVNLAIPFGWLPYGAMACAAGNPVPALLGTLGLGLIGAISLRRSYRTTLRLYTGQFGAKPRATARPVVPAAPADMRFLERKLPGLSEHASAIAVTNFRSLARAPEIRMLLLSPLIMIVVFGSMLLTRAVSPPELFRPFISFGAIAMILMTTMQVMGNQFGLDRDGFRVLVLSCAPRSDILLGKNLSLAPLSLVLSAITIAIVQALYPMRFTHVLATFAELLALFLICSMIGNLTSILAPMPVAAGSLKPASPKARSVVIHLILFFTFPIVFGLAALPLGIESLLHFFGWLQSVPIYLFGAMAQAAVICVVYRYVIRWQGAMLHSREQKILSVVASKVE